MRAAPCIRFAPRLALRPVDGTVPLCACRAPRSYSARVASARGGVPTFANAPIAGPSPALSIAMAEMNDYPVDEARVMRGDDDRIASAVESAVAMGFDADAATEAAKREIIKYPGRPDVAELVVDALLSDIGGGERALQLPAVMPQRYADAAAAAAERGAASASRAIDLTADSPEDPDAKRRKTAVDKGKGKAVEVVDVVAVDDDDEQDDGDRAPGAAPSGGNSLMAQLAAERRAREAARGGAPAPRGPFAAAPRSTAGDAARAGSGGSGGGGSGRLALTGAAARAAAGAAAISGSDAFGGSGIVDALLSGVAPLTEPLEEVRCLTYNVWFAEHVALVDRVQGLSDVIRDVDPHVICLQEVTPNILMLLHAQPWFEEYKGTPPPPQQYFTLTLFRRSMDKPDRTTRLTRREFPSSRMGRYADGVVGMSCGGGRELTVFTSHLESFISKEQNSSRERVAQLKDALRVIDGVVDRRAAEREARGEGGGVRNAIFMGDTNWDESTDGEVPLPSDWRDAWLSHGDGGAGYTYDLRRNPMMGGYLQKRLDRAFYRLEDFDVAGVRMVGTEPVRRRDGSAVTYVDEYRGRNQTRPVLPSDHFGLLVILAPKSRA